MKPLVCIAIVIGFLIQASSPAYSAQPLKIASIYAFSGVAELSNRPSVMGVRFAVQELNRQGGLLGRPIELVELDNRSTPIGSKVAADQAVASGVVAIIGASWSSHSLAIAKVAQSAGLPMITTDSTNERITRIGDYIFRVCYTDSFQGKVMARFAALDLKASTATIMINSTSDYSIGLADVFARQFSDFGGTIDQQVYYKHNQDHFRKEMDAVRKTGSDVLFIPGHDESAVILIEAVHAGVRSVPLGCDGWSTSNFFERGGNRLPMGYYCTHWSEDVQTKRSLDFVKRYKTNGQMLSTEALGYDAVMLMADAAKRANSVLPRQLKTALKATQGYPGVAGEISFNQYGDPMKETVVMQIRDGKATYLRTVRMVPSTSDAKKAGVN